MNNYKFIFRSSLGVKELANPPKNWDSIKYNFTKDQTYKGIMRKFSSTLEFCDDGYEIIRDIKQFTSMSISEGTIYPLLNRLKKEKLIASTWVEMETGVPRKYYRITEKGKKALDVMEAGWNQINRTMTKILGEK